MNKYITKTSVLFCFISIGSVANAQVAVRAETVYTMAGEPIRDGIVYIENGKIKAVGPAATTAIPAGTPMRVAKVVTPGLIDAHTCVGLTGYLNQSHDQEQIEKSAPIQPELRAMDAYNSQDALVEWVRGFGITTIHTGHGPGALVSGQTMIVKTAGKTVEDAVVISSAMVAATLGDSAIGDKTPGTRAKAIALLREELVKTQSYQKKMQNSDESKRPELNLRMETLAKVLSGELPILVTAHRHQDILSTLRLAKEFNLKLFLDGAADALLVIDEIKKSGFPVIVHPAMQRAGGETENLSFETAGKLQKAGIPILLQSGFEGYVPKTRVVLFEAAVAAAHGLGRDATLRTLTIDAAKLLNIDKRVGSIEIGKDGDLALFDGDPFEYTTHCLGSVVNGVLYSGVK
ncbi:MAG: amidohydrolase family protein [Planctomycetota bacterium]